MGFGKETATQIRRQFRRRIRRLNLSASESTYFLLSSNPRTMKRRTRNLSVCNLSTIRTRAQRWRFYVADDSNSFCKLFKWRNTGFWAEMRLRNCQTWPGELDRTLRGNSSNFIPFFLFAKLFFGTEK